jgi:hypothetical protein
MFLTLEGAAVALVVVGFTYAALAARALAGVLGGRGESSSGPG